MFQKRQIINPTLHGKLRNSLKRLSIKEPNNKKSILLDNRQKKNTFSSGSANNTTNSILNQQVQKRSNMIKIPIVADNNLNLSFTIGSNLTSFGHPRRRAGDHQQWPTANLAAPGDRFATGRSEDQKIASGASTRSPKPTLRTDQTSWQKTVAFGSKQDSPYQQTKIAELCRQTTTTNNK